METSQDLLFSGQAGLLTADQKCRMTDLPVTIIGAGATGCSLLIALAKMGFLHIRVIDFDIVSPRNYGNQFIFSVKHVDMPKVDALKDVVDFLGIVGNFTFINDKVTEANSLIDTELDQIIITTVDNMEARKVLTDTASMLPDGLLVDTRLGKDIAMGLAINVSNPIHMTGYLKNFMFTDAEAEPARCDETSHMGIVTWGQQFILNACWNYCTVPNKDNRIYGVTHFNCVSQETRKIYFK